MGRSGEGGLQPQGDAQRVQDLQQLQREYRHMELNRRAYAEESQQLLRKQQVKRKNTDNSLSGRHVGYGSRGAGVASVTLSVYTDCFLDDTERRDSIFTPYRKDICGGNTSLALKKMSDTYIGIYDTANTRIRIRDTVGSPQAAIRWREEC